MSPIRNNHIEYINEDMTTNEGTKFNNYQSAQKIRLNKKQSMGPDNHGMSATIHTTADA